MSFTFAIVVNWGWIIPSCACKKTSTNISNVCWHSFIPLWICRMFPFIIKTEWSWDCSLLISPTTSLFKHCKFSVKILSFLFTFCIVILNKALADFCIIICSWEIQRKDCCSFFNSWMCWVYFWASDWVRVPKRNLRMSSPTSSNPRLRLSGFEASLLLRLSAVLCIVFSSLWSQQLDLHSSPPMRVFLQLLPCATTHKQVWSLRVIPCELTVGRYLKACDAPEQRSSRSFSTRHTIASRDYYVT